LFLARPMNRYKYKIGNTMEKKETFNDYTALSTHAFRSTEPVLVLLDAGDYPTLMRSVLEDYLLQMPEHVQLLKIEGPSAKTIQTELKINCQTSILLFHEQQLKNICSASMGRHQLENIINQIQ